MAVFEIKRTSSGLGAFVEGREIGNNVDAAAYHSPKSATELVGQFGTAVTHAVQDVVEVAAQKPAVPVAGFAAKP